MKITKTASMAYRQKKEHQRKMKQFAREAIVAGKSFQEVLEMTMKEAKT